MNSDTVLFLLSDQFPSVFQLKGKTEGFALMQAQELYHVIKFGSYRETNKACHAMVIV